MQTCSTCNTPYTTDCLEKSVAYQVQNPTMTAGINAFIPTPDPLGQDDTPNIYRIVSVINDTDQDIIVNFMNTDSIAGQFIVPKSIKAFTKALISGYFVNNTIKVKSFVADAAGKVTFNFSS